MNLSLGIVGLPNVGKSTLFNALTKQSALVANYPFATIKPNVGIVPLPDKRVAKLAEIMNSRQTVPATVSFVDIAGLVAGANKGEGMGNSFLGNIREANAIVQVVRAFDNDDIQHVNQQVNPKQDMATVNTELVLADLQTITNQLEGLKKKTEAKLLVGLLQKASSELDNGQPLINSNSVAEYQETLTQLNLLTLKPVIYVFNLDEEGLKNPAKLAQLKGLTPTGEAICLSAKLEEELNQVTGAEANWLLKDYGIAESGLKALATLGFKTLGLQTFLTAGEKEAKAWTIKNGWLAPQAAGVIHSDFEKGFIAADIVKYEDLVEAGSWLTARSNGQCQTVGKDYQMQDGDVVEFKFNV